MHYTNKRISQLIIELGISQKKFANSIGATSAMVSRWVNGTATPSQESLRKICITFSVPFNYFIESNEVKDDILMSWNYLVMIEATNRYINCFGFSIRQSMSEEGNEDFTLTDKEGTIIRQFSHGELSFSLCEIMKTVNDKLFFPPRRNYLQRTDLSPLPTSNENIRKDTNNNDEDT